MPDTKMLLIVEALFLGIKKKLAFFVVVVF
jgi:hypothetical protein